MLKNKCLRSFTGMLFAFRKGELTIEEMDESIICINCSIFHALPSKTGTIGLEAAWHLKDVPEIDGHLVKIEDLPEEWGNKCYAFIEALWRAYEENRLYVTAHRSEQRNRYEEI